MTSILCPRMGRITDVQCCQTTLATTDRAAYGVCLACKHGQARAALSPIRPHDNARESGTSLHAAARVLSRTLGFVLDNYPGNERVTMTFLAQVAHRYGFDGGPLPLAMAAREARLKIASHGGQPAIIVNSAARSYARAQA